MIQSNIYEHIGNHSRKHEEMGADLDLQQRIAPPTLVLTPGFPEHQALSTMCFDFFEHVENMIFGLGAGLIDDHEFFRVVFATYSVDERR